MMPLYHKKIIFVLKTKHLSEKIHFSSMFLKHIDINEKNPKKAHLISNVGLYVSKVAGHNLMKF